MKETVGDDRLEVNFQGSHEVCGKLEDLLSTAIGHRYGIEADRILILSCTADEHGISAEVMVREE